MHGPNVTICSPFRDAGTAVDDYFERLSWLAGAGFRYVFVEGDSQDDTYVRLQQRALNDNRITLVKCDTGKRRYGSVVNAERFAALATVFNAALDAVDLEWSDYVLFLPSDIHYGPDMLIRLLAHDKDIVAPFVYDAPQGKPVFFDTWGFSWCGKNFGKFHQINALVAYGGEPIQMDTVGGTVLIAADVLRAGCRYTTDEVDRGLCKMAAETGFTVWADPATSVFHPPLVPKEDRGLADVYSRDETRVMEAIQSKYGFTPPDTYVRDFIRFVEELTDVARK